MEAIAKLKPKSKEVFDKYNNEVWQEIIEDWWSFPPKTRPIMVLTKEGFCYSPVQYDNEHQTFVLTIIQNDDAKQTIPIYNITHWCEIPSINCT
jgi:hypothetical protein